jgi:hypothetical protein
LLDDFGHRLSIEKITTTITKLIIPIVAIIFHAKSTFIASHIDTQISNPTIAILIVSNQIPIDTSSGYPATLS